MLYNREMTPPTIFAIDPSTLGTYNFVQLEEDKILASGRVIPYEEYKKLLEAEYTAAVRLQTALTNGSTLKELHKLRHEHIKTVKEIDAHTHELLVDGALEDSDVIVTEKVLLYSNSNELRDTAKSIGMLAERFKSLNVAYMQHGEVLRALGILHLKKHREFASTDTCVSKEMKRKFGDKGTKKNPGATYGFVRDTWQALGLAVAYQIAKGLNEHTYPP